MHKIFMQLARLYLTRKVRKRPPRPLTDLDLAKVQRVLLISSTALGDTLFSTPAIRALKETFPFLSLEVLGHRVFGSLLAHNPYVDRLWFYPGRNRRLLHLARDLRRRRYDLVIILHGNDPEATLLAYLTGSPFIIGSSRSPLALVYAATVAAPDPYAHAVERRLDYVRLLGADTRDKRMDLFLPPEAHREAGAILAGHFGEAPPLLMALHPGGSDPYKWWPADYFAGLAQELVKRVQVRFIIFSTRKEAAVSRSIAKNLGDNVLQVQGKYDLLEVAALMKKCRLFIANDSGPLHMALALGIPTLALIGADSPLRIGPYQVSNSTFLYKKEEVCREPRCLNQACRDNRCLKAISPEEALAVIEERFKPKLLKGSD